MPTLLNILDSRADELLAERTPLETVYALRHEFPRVAPSVISERVIAAAIVAATRCDCCNGALWPMATDGDYSHPYVERCDDCKQHPDDETAAYALRDRLSGGMVIFHLLHDDTDRGRWQPALHV